MSYTVDDMKRQFDATTFARGEAYARAGNVLQVGVSGDMLATEVRGSGGRIYRQSIELRDYNTSMRAHGRCDCPMSFNCKHVVAALLIGLREFALGRADSPVSLSADIWLGKVAGMRLQMKTPTATQRQQKGLLYVLTPAERRGLTKLHVCKVRTGKDGEVTGVSMFTDFDSLLSRQTAPFDVFDDEAVRLMAALRIGGSYDGTVEPSGRLGWILLQRLCELGRLRWSDSVAAMKRGEMLTLQPGPAREAHLAWQAVPEPLDAVALGWAFVDGGEVPCVMPTEPMCYRQGDQLGELTRPEALAALAPAVLHGYVRDSPRLRAHERAGVAVRLAKMKLEGLLPPPPAPETRVRHDIKPTPILELDACYVSLPRQTVCIDVAMLSFQYGGLVAEHDSEPVLINTEQGVIEPIARDLAAEGDAAALLAKLGMTHPAPSQVLGDEAHLWTLPTRADWLAFSRHDLPRLAAAGWKIHFGPEYRYEVEEADDWYADLKEEGEGINAWFALELGILVNGERHALLPLLLKMIRAAPAEFDPAAIAARPEDSEVLVELEDFTPVVLPWARVKPILSTLGELYFGERLGAALRLPYIDAARLAELEAAAQLRWHGGERLRALGRKLHSFEGIATVVAPAGLQAQLRDYQRIGLAWMQFLREYGFAGILADDMGLGKTIQTLAHILTEKEAGRLDAPALVVAPTSLMSNWQAEATRFTPGLRVLLLHGKDRKDGFEAIGSADLVLTTYALLARDEAALRRHRYHLLILDEAQYIKNIKAKATQTVRLLDARHRLCLTGTPVQNHLGELWSQFHFLMPGLLGDAKSFNADFRKPIEQGGDIGRRQLLARRIKPFMLRRTKDKVATELPPKTEMMLPVELGSGQRDLYETVRVAMDRKVRAEIDRKGLARSQIVILEALLKLRQVCCDPRLIRPADELGSAKLDALMELLDTLLAEGRKVLVFSQFTSMLALIECELRRREIAFALLTGDTEDRAAPVASFQNGEVPVFLISLKAGGVGLNLTAADTVIHYDPWWNPASENQATDRAWRIGQTQPVFVYKLIASGTLEEKIQEMQRRKGELADALLSGDAELGGGIDAADLQAIFAPLPS